MWGTRRNRRVKGRPRRRQERRLRLSGIIAGLKISAGLIGLFALSLSFIFVYDVLTQCDFFRSKKIVVAGTEHLTEPEVLRQAGVEKDSNTLAVNLSLTRKKLLRHPWIADAQVARILPSTIIITITEQEPLAVLDLGGQFIINSAGEVFKAWEEKDPRDLPRVTGLSFSDIRLERDQGSPAFDALMSFLELGRKEESVLPNRRIRRIHVDLDLGLAVYPCDEKKVVKLGFRNFSEKLRFLEVLLHRFDQQKDWTGLDTIDLANLNRVVVTPAKGTVNIGNGKEGVGAGT